LIKKNKKILIIIPARLESRRLPNKPILDIIGVPMIARVALRAKSLKLGRVIVASGNREICDVLKTFGIESILTRKTHKSGTDRVSEVFNNIHDDFDIIINLQGDLPIFKDELVIKTINILEDKKVDIATAACELKTEEINKKNIVKVSLKITNTIKREGYCLDFLRDVKYKENFFHHIGIYGYRPRSLKRFVLLTQSKNEKKRKLEQMRALDNNMLIKAAIVSDNPPGVDTVEDLEYVRMMCKKKISV